MTDILMDFDRKARCGVEEAVFCQSKSPQQITQIIELAEQQQRALLLTRLSPECYTQLAKDVQAQLDYHPVARAAIFGTTVPLTGPCRIAIVSGGASDASVCEEISLSLRYHGVESDLFQDVGVAGLWRLTQRLEEIRQYDLVIAVAGMEAALPTVLAGLVSAPVIAVPTSVGYGVAEGGKLALHACLGSCAAGMLTVNIDNGFGAACAAIKILNISG